MTARHSVVFLPSIFFIGLVIVGVGSAGINTPLKPAKGFSMTQVEQGRYLAKIAGCNDCHTPGYLLAEGKVAEGDWLLGEAFGWRGPWGTTYASNLRIFLNALSEEQWVAASHVLRARPPMPWFNLNAMHDDDLKAIYQFVKYLGTKGELAPPYLSPGIEPKTPYALFPAPPE